MSGHRADMSRSRSSVGANASVLGHGELASSLLLILPLLLIYEIGVVFASSINGVDFMTRTVLALVGDDRGDYLLIQLAFVGAYVGLVWHARRRGILGRGAVFPMVLESGIYALTLGSFIILIMQELMGFSLSMSMPIPAPDLSLGSTGEALIISLGAGVHEELVFRLGIMAGGAWLLRHVGVRVGYAVALSAGLSALLFSLAHHAGPYGEPFHVDVFTYRVLAGGVFAAIFYYRSLAHAVYTHFLYDVYVLVLQP